MQTAWARALQPALLGTCGSSQPHCTWLRVAYPHPRGHPQPPEQPSTEPRQAIELSFHAGTLQPPLPMGKVGWGGVSQMPSPMCRASLPRPKALTPPGLGLADPPHSFVDLKVVVAREASHGILELRIRENLLGDMVDHSAGGSPGCRWAEMMLRATRGGN